jgi:hypothetical protein
MRWHRPLHGNVGVHHLIVPSQPQGFARHHISVAVRREINFAGILAVQVGQQIQQAFGRFPRVEFTIIECRVEI